MHLAYVHVLTLSASAASAPSDRSFATVPSSPAALAKCNADCLEVTSCREARTRKCHCDVSATTHAPNRASCATCRSKAPASLVASMSSAAAVSCPLPTASHRAVLPFCTFVWNICAPHMFIYILCVHVHVFTQVHAHRTEKHIRMYIPIPNIPYGDIHTQDLKTDTKWSCLDVCNMPLLRLLARHPHQATEASPTFPAGQMHWPSATLIACRRHDPVERHAHARARQCPAPPSRIRQCPARTTRPFLLSCPPSPPLRPAPSPSLSRPAFPRPRPLPILSLARVPHTTHAPNRASCATCRSKAPASLVASMSSAAAASCLP